MKINTNMKVLVVDDCIDTRNFIELVLKKRGFTQVLGASDGAEGLNIMARSFDNYEPVELVLADWQMPAVDGITFLDNLRVDGRFKEVPFIMITSDSDREHVLEAIDHGVDNYLVKPVVEDSLYSKICTTLKKTP